MEVGGSESEGDMRTGAEVLVVDLEEGGRAHEPKSVGDQWKKGKKTDSPLEPPEGIQPCQHPDFSPVRSRLTSNLRAVR